MPISKRLQYIAHIIDPSHRFADIGSDHAYLPCYICLQNNDAQAIASEVAKGPFDRALQTVKQYNLTNRIDVRFGNGLDVLNKEDHIADIVISGMGGTLIANILLTGKEQLTHINRLILQPNNNEIKVRKTLKELGFILVKEQILEENDLFYEILVAERQDITEKNSPYKEYKHEKQLFLGPYLSKERSSTFVRKWKEEHRKLIHTIAQMEVSNDKTVQQKVKVFQQRINWIEEVIS